MKRVPLGTKILSGLCIASLLYGSISQASMPLENIGVPQTGHTSTVIYNAITSKTHTYDANGNHAAGSGEHASFGESPNWWTNARISFGATKPEATAMLHDGYDAAAEYTGDEAILANLYVTAGLDENISMTRMLGPDAGTYYYSHDRIGSVRTVTDALGMVKNAHDYTAFGVPYNSTVAIDQRYGYPGQEMGSVPNAMHYRHRNYNPALGRFDSRDPLYYSSDSNLYSYVSNTPNNYVDPFGLELYIRGPEQFRHKVGGALQSLCPGINAHPFDSSTWRISMDNCPSKDDIVCSGLYDIIQNNHKNVIINKEDGHKDIVTTYEDGKGVRIPKPDGGFIKGKETRGIIEMKNKHFLAPSELYSSIHGPISGRERTLPWATVLAHEFGHISLLNQGLHPNINLGVKEAESESMRWENFSLRKLGHPYQRIKYK